MPSTATRPSDASSNAVEVLFTGLDRGVEHGRDQLFARSLPLELALDDDVLLAWEGVEEVVRRFEPELLLVSCGFDAHVDDPLGGLRLSADCFRELARRTTDLAPRRAVVLEGGYNLRTLPDLLEATLEGFEEGYGMRTGFKTSPA